MHPNQTEHEQMREIMLENQRLLKENNRLLQKVHRNAVLSFWLRVLWFVIIIGLPFILYYYVIEPYFEAFGSSFERFQDGLQEVPGWKQFYEQIGGRVDASEGIELSPDPSPIEYEVEPVPVDEV